MSGVEPGFCKMRVAPGFVSPKKSAAVRFGRFEPLVQLSAFRVGEGHTVELAGYQFFNGMFGCLHSIYITDETPKTLPLAPDIFYDPAKKAETDVCVRLFGAFCRLLKKALREEAPFSEVRVV
ncbi:hypothetical protein [Alistipes sp.]|uniref:hypothetical protein n=1 Tax=Alistipes sp. TaxID=1872444 RepID=UPI00307F029E